MSGSNTFGTCSECARDSFGFPNAQGDFFCGSCWDDYELFDRLDKFGCVTFCAVYDTDGTRLAVGGSVDKCCAERNALWKLRDEANVPKVLIVCRVRKHHRAKVTFNVSKPCEQCIYALPFYNVVRVAYSVRGGAYKPHAPGGEYTWVDAEDLRNEYSTCSKVILRL